MGEFKIMSNTSTDGIDLPKDSYKLKRNAKGKSCLHIMPLDLASMGRKEARIQVAFQQAVMNARETDYADGAILLNTKIKQRNLSIPLLYSYNFVSVTGHLISKKTEERTEPIAVNSKKETVKNVIKKATKSEITDIVPNPIPTVPVPGISVGPTDGAPTLPEGNME